MRLLLLDGPPAAALLEYAREEGIDLVVMTTHGRSGPPRRALGTVADRVAQGGTVAVLLTPVGPADQADQP